MSEQTPVEELIGWREDWPDGSAPYKVWWNEHGSLPLGTHATVDDLADWLRQRAESIDLGWLCDDDCRTHPDTNGPWCVSVFGDWRTTHAEGPTILAALEAAVRAVHEQETSE